MANSEAIDRALMAALAADATLHALLPDGVYWAESPPGATRFVIVSLMDADDGALFGGRGYESMLYAVKAVTLGTSGIDAEAAAARIEALLEDQSLTVTGYAPMTMHREGRDRRTEVDADDLSVRWQHYVRYIRVQMALTG